MKNNDIIRFLILFMALFSSIGVYVVKDDEASWNDKSIIIISFTAAITWSFYFTFLL